MNIWASCSKNSVLSVFDSLSHVRWTALQNDLKVEGEEVLLLFLHVTDQFCDNDSLFAVDASSGTTELSFRPLRTIHHCCWKDALLTMNGETEFDLRRLVSDQQLPRFTRATVSRLIKCSTVIAIGMETN